MRGTNIFFGKKGEKVLLLLLIGILRLMSYELSLVNTGEKGCMQ